MKPVLFLGDSREALRTFPDDARRHAGYQIDRVQRGREPNDWKPIRSIGPGVREIRIRDAAGAFRVIYVATFVDAVYILHAFQKKSQATPRRDLDLAAARLKELMQRARR
jgi:phage-related protein